MPELPKTLIPHWRIEGTLTTLSPLRIGDGSIDQARIPRKDNKGNAVEVQSVFLDFSKRAYLPGSGLKGFLRSYVSSRLADEKLVRAIFGYQDETSQSSPQGHGLGGAVTVCDARIKEERVPPDSRVSDPYWNRQRATCVASHVVVERRTRTAAEGLLFFEEYVPSGVSFGVTLFVEGGDLGDSTSEEIASVLIAALSQLKDSSARLGASNAENWGHLEWELTSVRQLTESSISKWLGDPGSLLINHLELMDPTSIARAGTEILNDPASRWLTFSVDLNIPGPFLVNDPSRTKQKDDRDSDKPNHTPLRTVDGKPVLPGASLHGALRSQAERIARTLAAGQASQYVHDPSAKTGFGQKPAIVNSLADLHKLDAVSCLFGAPGWRSALRVGAFTLTPASTQPKIVKQEFVAIDRFTGGGADELKFNAEGFVAPNTSGFTMRGTISLDLHALGRLISSVGPPDLVQGSPADWNDVIYLLAYTLRDLCEGDIPLGFGRSKGYGSLTAQVQVESFNPSTSLPTGIIQLMRNLFAEPTQLDRKHGS